MSSSCRCAWWDAACSNKQVALHGLADGLALRCAVRGTGLAQVTDANLPSRLTSRDGTDAILAIHPFVVSRVPQASHSTPKQTTENIFKKTLFNSGFTRRGFRFHLARNLTLRRAAVTLVPRVRCVVRRVSSTS
jgi:hypothetical protein